jgi:hypothetical protein
MPEKETEQGHATEEKKTTPGTGVKRPLVPVVLALMLGLAGAAWGLQIPGVWLVVALVGLLAVLVGLYFFLPLSGVQRTSEQNGNEEPTELPETGDD